MLELDGRLKDAIPPILSLLGALPDLASADQDNSLSGLQELDEMIRRFNARIPSSAAVTH